MNPYSIKRKGYLAEKLVKEKLEKYFYIPIKGISTKGVDVVALNKYLALIIEVKSFNNYLKIEKRQIENLFKEEEKIKKFLDIKTLKLVALIKGKEFKYLLVKEVKDIVVNKKTFDELPNFDYYLLLKEIENF